MNLLLATAAALVAATVQSGTGFGFALLLGPALVALLAPGQAIAGVLVLGVELNLLVLFAERRRRSVAWDRIRSVVIAAIPGLIAGALIVRAISKATLQLVVGVAVLAGAAAQVASRRDSAPHKTTGPANVAVGLLTGVVTTATSVSGAVLVLWLHNQGLATARLRDSLSAAFLWLNLAGAAVLVLVPGTHARAGHLDWLAALVPAVAVGHLLGRLVFERLSAEQHESLVLGCVILAGLVSLVTGALRLG